MLDEGGNALREENDSYVEATEEAERSRETENEHRIYVSRSSRLKLPNNPLQRKRIEKQNETYRLR